MDSVPTYDMWMTEMADMMNLERLRFHNEEEMCLIRPGILY